MKLDVKLSKENTHIGNSYVIKLKSSMRQEMDFILSRRDGWRYPITRSVESYVREWAGHNRLYNIGEYLKKKGVFTKLGEFIIEHAKDADLEEYIGVRGKIKGFFLSIIWLILGGV